MMAQYGDRYSNMQPLKEQPYPHFHLLKNDNGSGFVIVAADDRITPIIAYSDLGTVAGEIPPSVDAWLQEYELQIEFLIGKFHDVPSRVSDSWLQLSESGATTPQPLATTVVAPLLSTTWGQSPYYNNLCPTGTYTGCVATAMAQVMKYWNHPYVGEGQHSYTHVTYGHLSADFKNTYYNWTSMPNTLTSSSSALQMNAVATLMYHCGVAVEMAYADTGSGAAVISEGRHVYPCAERAFSKYFDYNESIQGLKRLVFSDQIWNNIMQQELSLNRPIIYTGNGSGAHAFILDGVNNIGHYHVNWGWGGAWDGFFLLDAMYPNNDPGRNNYSYNQCALIGIEPNPTMLKTTPATLSMPVAAGVDTIWVRTNPQNASQWTASTDQSWVHLSRTTGPGNGQQTKLVVTTDANPTGSQRTADITIVQGAESYTVRLLQSDGVHSVSDWYGSEETGFIFFIRSNQEYFIRPEAFGTFRQGAQLTKVRFNIYDDIRNSGDMMTVRIYEDNTLPGVLYATRSQYLGQVVYSQNYPMLRFGVHEVVLDAPYIVTDKNFWVSIQPSDSVVLWMGKDYILDTIPTSQRNLPSRISGAYLRAEGGSLIKSYGFDRLASDSTRGRQYNWMNAISVYVNTDTRYSLQVQTSSLAMGNVNAASGVYANMSTVSLTATAFPGFRFGQWSDGVVDNPRSISLWKDSTIVALFEQDNYTLNLNVLPDITFGTTVGGGDHPCGSPVLFGAIPADGYRFSHWSDANSDNPRQITLSADVSLSAYFTLAPIDTVYVYDTSYVNVPYAVHDTTYVPITDTLTLIQTDTVAVMLVDTLTFYQTDTLIIHHTDTIYIERIVHDTVYIYDTVYVGVDDVQTVNYMLYQQGGQIVVEGAEGSPVTVYDAVGRVLATRRDTYGPVRFDAPAAGTYLVRVGSAAARRIVVVR